ncbi:hypothetical protein C8D04_1127 [Simplicispira sp. 125]|jgi:hypothetical protein|nr:hypothetical protein C8D04_1127 [Simplicispira sp. 125]REG16853.1 hypothetical protein C8D01_1436 [Simplicispira sp. 110]
MENSLHARKGVIAHGDKRGLGSAGSYARRLVATGLGLE